MASKTTTVCISGGIAAGKSTLHDALKKHYADNPAVAFCDEPIGCMMQIACDNGRSLFANFIDQVNGCEHAGKASQNYAFLFQHRMMLQRVADACAAAQALGVRVIVMERSIVDDRKVFCELLAGKGHLTADELDAIDSWQPIFDLAAPAARPDVFVRVQTNVDTCLERISRRGRDGETYERGYLAQLELQEQRMFDEMSADHVVFDNLNPLDTAEWQRDFAAVCHVIDCAI